MPVYLAYLWAPWKDWAEHFPEYLFQIAGSLDEEFTKPLITRMKEIPGGQREVVFEQNNWRNYLMLQ